MTSLFGARVVVTGGAGFIGSHLVDELVSRRFAGHVTVLDSLCTGSRANLAQWTGDARVSVVHADIRSRAALRALEGADVVFHLAAAGIAASAADPAEAHEINATGTLRLLTQAHAVGVRRFVHVSTGRVYGPPQRRKIDEGHPTFPHTAYGATKLSGEAYARAAHRTAGLPVTVVRPFAAYGPRGRLTDDGSGLLARAIVHNLCGLPAQIRGDRERTCDLLHVTDMARALAALAQSDEAIGRTLNLGAGEEIAIGIAVETVAWLVGRPDLDPIRLESRPSDPRRVAVDTHLLHRLTGFTPAMPFEVGVAELVRWFRARPRTPEQLLAQLADHGGAPVRVPA